MKNNKRKVPTTCGSTATPPSFALAVMLDYTNSLHGEPTVIDWSKSEAS